MESIFVFTVILIKNVFSSLLKEKVFKIFNWNFSLKEKLSRGKALWQLAIVKCYQ